MDDQFITEDEVPGHGTRDSFYGGGEGVDFEFAGGGARFVGAQEDGIGGGGDTGGVVDVKVEVSLDHDR